MRFPKIMLFAVLALALAGMGCKKKKDEKKTDAPAGDVKPAGGDTKPTAGGDTKPADPSPAANTGGAGSDLDHQLFQAAAASGDVAIMTAINKKVGIADENGVPNDKMEAFMNGHTDWAMKNAQWIMDNATDPAKAKAWLDANNK